MLHVLAGFLVLFGFSEGISIDDQRAFLAFPDLAA
jgi:hypothetical protein